MPLLRQSLIQKHAPKTIKFADLYKHSLKRKDFSSADRLEAQKALQKSGYDNSMANKILAGKDLSIARAKEIASKLSTSGVKGFDKNDPNSIVNQYVKKEAIRRKNLAQRLSEHTMEALGEDLYTSKTPGAKVATKSGGISKPKLNF